MILLFAGGLVAGACGGFFVLGMASAARYADCKDRREPPGRRPLEGGRPVAVSETWRDVPGYGGKYQASDMGHIANTFWHGQKRKNGGRTILTQYKRKPRGKAKYRVRNVTSTSRTWKGT